jgi:hypothetical protein
MTASRVESELTVQKISILSYYLVHRGRTANRVNEEIPIEVSHSGVAVQIEPSSRNVKLK